uniref:Uncharacterized protein n=1 Tax=Rhizophora mucronata TaxID=61149 RepID=A0A2P2Q6H4_RHIMU
MQAASKSAWKQPVFVFHSRARYPSGRLRCIFLFSKQSSKNASEFKYIICHWTRKV